MVLGLCDRLPVDEVRVTSTITDFKMKKGGKTKNKTKKIGYDAWEMKGVRNSRGAIGVCQPVCGDIMRKLCGFISTSTNSLHLLWFSLFFFFLNNSNTKNEISTSNLAQEELVNYFFFFMLLRDAIRLLRCSLFYLSCPFSSSSSFCFTRVLCPVSHREYGVTRARTLLFFFLCLSLTRSSENKTKQKQSKGGNRGTRSMKRGEGRARPSKMPKM